MNFSFIICTSNPNSERIETSIKTIEELKIPEYEIIIVGGQRANNNASLARYISFDEVTTPGWITRKKNLAAKQSKFENLVIMHDYFSFDYDWYKHWVEFSKETNWDIASNRILGINNQRIHTDWTTYDHPVYPQGFPLPYDDWTNTKNQYISGGYFLVKRHIFIEYPLNENLTWNEEEDVDWSLRIRNKFKIVCNGKSTVRHTKWHSHLYCWNKLDKKFKKMFNNEDWRSSNLYRNRDFDD
jgi:hypothetical protein